MRGYGHGEDPDQGEPQAEGVARLLAGGEYKVADGGGEGHGYEHEYHHDDAGCEYALQVLEQAACGDCGD